MERCSSNCPVFDSASCCWVLGTRTCWSARTVAMCLVTLQAALRGTAMPVGGCYTRTLMGTAGGKAAWFRAGALAAEWMLCIRGGQVTGHRWDLMGHSFWFKSSNSGEGFSVAVGPHASYIGPNLFLPLCIQLALTRSSFSPTLKHFCNRQHGQRFLCNLAVLVFCTFGLLA